MNDIPQYDVPTPARELFGFVLQVFLIVLIGVFSYEYIKELIYPNLTLWQSHFITIIFSALVAGVVAFVLWRRYQRLKQQVIQGLDERRKAEEDLRQMYIVFRDATDPILIEDLSGRIINLNAEAERVYGWTRKELLGLPIKTLVPPERHQQADELLARCKGGEKVRNVEGLRWCKSGKVHPVLLNLSLLTDVASEPLGIASIAKDITEIKRAEEALQRAHDELEERVAERTRELEEANFHLKELDSLKTMFVASMSHELRTPLNSIIGFTGIILKGMVGEVNPKQKDQLGRVYNAAKHLLALISDVIDVSKVEAGKIEIFPEGFALDELINGAIESIQTQIEEKELALEVSVPQGVQLHTDKRRLLQCVLNYLGNAVKFTEAGRISVTGREIDGEVEITVSDTGIGIPQERLSDLFQPFVRLESHLKLKRPGTGLGLYLTKKLVTEMLRGKVAVESRPGAGTTFMLTIPKEIRPAPFLEGLTVEEAASEDSSSY